jgi:hypothetical protein
MAVAESTVRKFGEELGDTFPDSFLANKPLPPAHDAGSGLLMSGIIGGDIGLLPVLRRGRCQRHVEERISNGEVGLDRVCLWRVYDSVGRLFDKSAVDADTQCLHR